MPLRFEVLTPVNINISINITVIWPVTPIICVNRYQRFSGRGLKASGIWRAVLVESFRHFKGSRRVHLQRLVSAAILRNVGRHFSSDIASHPRKLDSSTTTQWEPQISDFGGTSSSYQEGYRWTNME